MLQIRYTTEIGGNTDLVPENMTVREFCVSHHLDTTRMMTIGGVALAAADFDNPLSTYAVDSKVDILVLAKTQNG